LVELLSPFQVVVLGYYLVPDQAAPEQLRADHEAEATGRIDQAAARFADRGADVETIVVFTHDRSETIDHVAAEYGVDAVLTPGKWGEHLGTVLVPLRGDENLESIVSFVSDLAREGDASVMLFNVADSEDDASRGEMLLRGVCDRLEEDGVDRDRVAWRQERGDSPSDAIVAAAEAYDVLVLGESEPSHRERIFGPTTGRVVDRITRPALVVRNA
jgi:nucleotide-binding universal stress UspA family protein